MRIVFVSFLLLSACDMGFEIQSEIQRVRVLAVKATPPEWTVPTTPVGISQLTVDLEALAVSPSETAPSVRFALCKFGNPYAADFECPGKDGLDLPDNKLSLLDKNVQAFTQLPVEAGPPGTPPGALLPDKISFFIGYEASDGSGSDKGLERGVFQFNFRRTDSPNQNPTLVDVLYEGASLVGPLKTGTQVSLTPLLSGDSRESFLNDEGKEVQEAIGYSWYATGNGEFDYLRTQTPREGENDNTFNLYTTAPNPEKVTFFVVARDGRGGVSWQSKIIQVETLE